MKNVDIEKLRIAVNQFYLNKYMDQPTITDREFDLLRFDYESEHGSVKQLIEFPEGLVSEINEPETGLSKTVCDGDFINYIDDFIKTNEITDLYLNYKYDGCGIKAYYKNGRLYKIQSTPDEEYGIIRTKAFLNLFPDKLQDKTIKCLRGEVLVKADEYGELARNAANGLTNSQYKESEVASNAFIRIYKVQFDDESTYNYERHKLALESLPKIYRHNDTTKQDELVFSSAEKLPITKLPNSTIITEGESGIKFQVDGVVLYSPQAVEAFKFYYTDFKIVEVKNIAWNYNPGNGSYTPVLEFDSVILNDKSISRCSCNGVPRLVEDQMGIGSEVKVILANLTIPKVIDVIKPSTNFNYPTCGCGHQLSYDDLVGSNIKCSNLGVCSQRKNEFIDKIKNWLYDSEDESGVKYKSFKSSLLSNHLLLVELLGIDRFNPTNKYRTSRSAAETVLSELRNNKLEDVGFIMSACSELTQLALDMKSAFNSSDNDRAIELQNQLLEQLTTKLDDNSFLNDTLCLINSGGFKDFGRYFYNWFSCSDLQYRDAEIKFSSLLSAVREFIKLYN